MVERKKGNELPLGDEWLIFGTGVGLKTTDIQRFEQTASVNFRVLRGISIGVSHFHLWLAQNHLTVFSDCYTDHELQLPADIGLINKKIVDILPTRRPVIVRSSALDEKGGSGIYTSNFFVPTGNRDEDLMRLAQVQNSIYLSFFTDRAKAHREKAIPGQESGMSILIQPVVGDEHNGFFMPSLSGILTTANGEPVLRIVIGLGTKAVEMEEAIVLRGANITAEKVMDLLYRLNRADAINLTTGELESLRINQQMIELAKAQQGKLELLLREWRANYDLGKPDYVEFALAQSEQKPVVLQVSPDKITPVVTELGAPQGAILCEGSDVVNTGTRYGRGIFWLGEQGLTPKDLDYLANFNRKNHGYLLFVPDIAFSRIAGDSHIGMQHFNNAAGVIEVQHQPEELNTPGFLTFGIDHTSGRGGTHFAEICKRQDILFLGVTMSENGGVLRELLGRPTSRLGFASSFWEVECLMTNAVSGGRVELLGKVVEYKFSLEEIQKWAYELREVANELNQIGNRRLSAAFYVVAYLLSEKSVAVVGEFDPFDISKLLIDKKTKRETIKSLELVLKNIDLTESSDWFEMYQNYHIDSGDEKVEFRLKKYLERLLALLLTQ